MELPLKDIHLPEPISWWPPALGWWLLLALILGVIAFIFLVRWLYLRYRKPAWYYDAKQLLQTIEYQYKTQADANVCLRELSMLLRRVSLSHDPDPLVASLTGKAWLRYLDKILPQAKFNTELGQLLITIPFQNKSNIESRQVFKLLKLAQQWLSIMATRKFNSC